MLWCGPFRTTLSLSPLSPSLGGGVWPWYCLPLTPHQSVSWRLWFEYIMSTGFAVLFFLDLSVWCLSIKLYVRMILCAPYPPARPSPFFNVRYLFRPIIECTFLKQWWWKVWGPRESDSLLSWLYALFWLCFPKEDLVGFCSFVVLEFGGGLWSSCSIVRIVREFEADLVVWFVSGDPLLFCFWTATSSLSVVWIWRVPPKGPLVRQSGWVTMAFILCFVLCVGGQCRWTLSLVDGYSLWLERLIRGTVGWGRVCRRFGSLHRCRPDRWLVTRSLQNVWCFFVDLLFAFRHCRPWHVWFGLDLRK